jgi:hypothetical protein
MEHIQVYFLRISLHNMTCAVVTPHYGLLIATKPKAKYRFRVPAMLLFYVQQKRCLSDKIIQDHIICGAIFVSTSEVRTTSMMVLLIEKVKVKLSLCFK